jgi:rhodanese-related sulfurtransferase
VKLTRRTLLAAIPAAVALACDRDPSPGSGSAPTPPTPLGPMISPAELAKRADDVKAGRVVVLYVGPDLLFEQGHVPGAKRLPEAGTAEGYDALVKAIDATPKDAEIVVYCGCCPYRSCQNVRPASKALRASGRTNAKYLDLPTNFKTDWAKKGYPVERS